jgi:transposase-like protein
MCTDCEFAFGRKIKAPNKVLKVVEAVVRMYVLGNSGFREYLNVLYAYLTSC